MCCLFLEPNCSGEESPVCESYNIVGYCDCLDAHHSECLRKFNLFETPSKWDEIMFFISMYFFMFTSFKRIIVQ